MEGAQIRKLDGRGIGGERGGAERGLHSVAEPIWSYEPERRVRAREEVVKFLFAPAELGLVM